MFHALGYSRVELGSSFMAMLKATSLELSNFKIEIPSIPTIPKMSNVGFLWDILRVLVTFVNGLVYVINIVVTIINYVIQVIQFLVILVKNLVTFKNNTPQGSDNFPYIPIIY